MAAILKSLPFLTLLNSSFVNPWCWHSVLLVRASQVPPLGSLQKVRQYEWQELMLHIFPTS